MSAEPEHWYLVPRFPNYEGSDWGRVRSIPHWDTNNHWHPGQILNPWLDEADYQHVTLYRDGEVKKPYVHQVIAWIFLGECPEDMEVCHGPGGKDDNRPSNLSYGPHSKNAGEDKHRDGTFLHGDGHQNSKLTVAIVGECRRRAAAGERHEALAREFGVHQGTMSTAITGGTWQDCPVPPAPPGGSRKGAKHQDAKLTDEIVRECRARHAAGETKAALAREFGVSFPAMHAAITGKTWKHVA